MNDLMQRAERAYFRSGNGSQIDMPSESCSSIEGWDGRDYVALRNGDRVLAVFRVRSGGKLKRLRRWPAELGASHG